MLNKGYVVFLTKFWRNNLEVARQFEAKIFRTVSEQKDLVT